MNKIKFLFCIALLVSGVKGRAQIYINSYAFGIATPTDLLLDSFGTNIQVAYSLRKLDKDYTGNCITVQKVGGDTSVIGFSGNYLDTIVLKNFCGTGATDSCFVLRWFDQSGNANNSFSNNVGQRPRIMTNGVINYDGAEPTLVFDGINDRLIIDSAVAIKQSFTIFTLFKPTNEITSLSAFGVLLSGNNIGSASYSELLIALGSFTGNLSNERISFLTLLNSQVYGTGQTTENFSGENILSYLFNDSTNGSEFYRNNALKTLTASNPGDWNDPNYNPNDVKGIFFRNGNSASFLNGNLKELLIYNSNKATDRSGINTNINNFYSIY